MGYENMGRYEETFGHEPLRSVKNWGHAAYEGYVKESPHNRNRLLEFATVIKNRLLLSPNRQEVSPIPIQLEIYHGKDSWIWKDETIELRVQMFVMMMLKVLNKIKVDKFESIPVLLLTTLTQIEYKHFADAGYDKLDNILIKDLDKVFDIIDNVEPDDQVIYDHNQIIKTHLRKLMGKK